MQVLAKLDDVVALVHLDREQDRRFTANPRIIGRVFVDAVDAGDVAKVHGLPGLGNIDHDVADLIFGLERGAGLDLHLGVTGRHAAGVFDRVSALKGLRYILWVDAVLRQLLPRRADLNALLLIADALDLRDRRDGADRSFDALRVVSEIAVTIGLALYRDEH